MVQRQAVPEQERRRGSRGEVARGVSKQQQTQQRWSGVESSQSAVAMSGGREGRGIREERRERERDESVRRERDTETGGDEVNRTMQGSK
jgi:hypothetical protein